LWKIEKLEIMAGKVENFANKVDWTINTGWANVMMRPAFIGLSGKLNTVEDVVRENAKLSDNERLEKAEEILWRKLTKRQKEAILKAHYVWSEREWAGVYNYTIWELLEKNKILKEAGFTKAEREKLVRQGLVGEEVKKWLSTEEFFNNFVNWLEKEYPELKKYVDKVWDKNRFVKYVKEYSNNEDIKWKYEKLYWDNALKALAKDAVIYSKFDFLDVDNIFKYRDMLLYLLKESDKTELAKKLVYLLEGLDKETLLANTFIRETIDDFNNRFKNNKENNLFDAYTIFYDTFNSELLRLYLTWKLNIWKWWEVINFLKDSWAYLDDTIKSYNIVVLRARNFDYLKTLPKDKLEKIINNINKIIGDTKKENKGEFVDNYNKENTSNKTHNKLFDENTEVKGKEKESDKKQNQKEVYLLENKVSSELKQVLDFIKNEGTERDRVYLSKFDFKVAREFVKTFSKEDFDKIKTLVKNKISLRFDVLGEDVFSVIDSLSDKDIHNILEMKQYFDDIDLVAYYKAKAYNDWKNIDLFLKNKDLLNNKYFRDIKIWSYYLYSNDLEWLIKALSSKAKLFDSFSKFIWIRVYDNYMELVLKSKNWTYYKKYSVHIDYFDFINDDLLQVFVEMTNKWLDLSDYSKLFPEFVMYAGKLSIEDIKHIWLIRYFFDEKLLKELLKYTATNGSDKLNFLLKNNPYLFELVSVNNGYPLKFNNLDEVIEIVKQYKNLEKQDLSLDKIKKIKNPYLKEVFLRKFLKNMDKDTLKEIKIDDKLFFDIARNNLKILYELYRETPNILNWVNPYLKVILEHIWKENDINFWQEAFKKNLINSRILDDAERNNPYFKEQFNYLIKFSAKDELIDMIEYSNKLQYVSSYKWLLNYCNNYHIMKWVEKLIFYGFVPKVNNLLRYFSNNPKVLSVNRFGWLVISEYLNKILNADITNIWRVADTIYYEIERLTRAARDW